MKKLFTAASVALLLLAACEKGPENGEMKFRTVGTVDRIEISNVGGVGWPAEVTDVAFVARFHMPDGAIGGATGFDDGNGNDVRVMRRVPFDASGTTILLPQNPPSELLADISRDFPKGFEISDPEAKTVSFTEIACNLREEEGRGGRYYRFFHMYLSRESESYEVRFIYCNRPATVKGEGEDWWGHPAVYDLSLQKGWNMVVEKTDYSGGSQKSTFTNLMPEGIGWEYNMWL